MPRGCRICQFWEKYPYRVSERELFDKKCREGTSLRRLELLLEAYGLKAKKDLIRKHIQTCMNAQAKEQREIEKSIKKDGIKAIHRKIKSFFVKQEEPKWLCSHTLTEVFFSLPHERLFVRCKVCGELLTPYGIDAEDLEKRQQNDPRNLVILKSLRK